MKRVLKEGNHEVWKKIKKEAVLYKASATIDGQVVEVTYRIIDGVRRLSTAWIQ